jgi:hypothetical protein
MGSQQSTSGKSEACQPCFAFQAPFRQKYGNHNNSDPLGSPVPDTPMAQRKQRENGRRNDNNKENPIFSSRYGGLEKEVDAASRRTNENTTKDTLDMMAESQQFRAEIHEGQVGFFVEEGVFV